jgi:glyoxylase-like metal-dependent hydrolase (beta-lactamase superfamily II)
MMPVYSVLVEGNNVRLEGGFLGLSSIVLIESNGKRILVDTGHHVTRLMLLKALEDRGLTPDDIDFVLLTHLHFDHANNVDLFKRARILVSKKEWEYAADPHPDDHFVPSHIRSMLLKMNLEIFEVPPEIAPGVAVIETPGHTPGHCSVLVTTEKGITAVAGDAIKYPKETLSQCCDAAFGAIDKGAESIVMLMKLADHIIPGHFPEIYRVGDGRFAWGDGADFKLIIR